MAKDRTRHARRREPARNGMSLYRMVAQDIGRALIGFAEGTWQALFDFANAVSNMVVGAAELCRRLNDGI